MNDYTVYVAFHQKGKTIAKDSVYTPLQVGKAISHVELDMLNDSKEDSISHKNEIYSELTGWYWIWKNKKHDFIGTSHYRRYFTQYELSFFRKIHKTILFLVGIQKKRHGLIYIKDPKIWESKIISKLEIQHLLKKYDIILPQKKKFKYTVYEQYKRRHNEKDILLTRKIIEEQFPDYIAAFDNTFKDKEMYSFNMFIMPWDLFDKYMKWLFTILFELEKRAEIDLSDKYQKRVCAFMAERLQTVWIRHNTLNIKELTILYFKKLKTTHF